MRVANSRALRRRRAPTSRSRLIDLVIPLPIAPLRQGELLELCGALPSITVRRSSLIGDQLAPCPRPTRYRVLDGCATNFSRVSAKLSQVLTIFRS